MQKLRTEEREDRVEPILALRVRKVSYFGTNVLVAMLAPAGYVVVAGALVATIASRGDIGLTFGDVMWQAIATVPAVWTVIAVSIAVVGAKPEVAMVAWAGVLLSFALTLLGPTFKLWDWVLDISPFAHVPNVTLADVDAWGLVWITLVTVLLTGLGCVGFRRRDIG